MALARAARLAGEVEEAGACKARAKELADAIKKPDERQMLLKDLESVWREGSPIRGLSLARRRGAGAEPQTRRASGCYQAATLARKPAISSRSRPRLS